MGYDSGPETRPNEQPSVGPRIQSPLHSGIRKPMVKKASAVFVLVALLVLAFQLVSRAEQIFGYSDEIGLALFFCVIVTEVVLAPVPGGIISFLGSAHFGFWSAWPLIYGGNLIGSSIAFALAHRYGRPIVDRMTDKESRDRYDRVVSGHRGRLWLVYMLPVFPIDVISFMCGFSALRYRTWLPIMASGMLSYSFIVSSVGAYFGQFVPYLGGITAVVSAVFIVGVLWFLASLRSV